MRRSIYKKSKTVLALASTSIATNATTNGASVDLLQALAGDYRSVLFVVQSDTITDGTYTLGVEHSDDNATWSSAADEGLQGSGQFVTTDDNAIREIGYAGSKRYCRVTVTSTGVTTGGAFSGVAVLYDTAAHQR